MAQYTLSRIGGEGRAGSVRDEKGVGNWSLMNRELGESIGSESILVLVTVAEY